MKQKKKQHRGVETYTRELYLIINTDEETQVSRFFTAIDHYVIYVPFDVRASEFGIYKAGKSNSGLLRLQQLNEFAIHQYLKMKVTLKKLPGQEEEEKNKNLKVQKRRTWLDNRKDKVSPEKYHKQIVNARLLRSLQAEMALRCEIHLNNLREMRSRLEAMQRPQSMELIEETIKVTEHEGSLPINEESIQITEGSNQVTVESFELHEEPSELSEEHINLDLESSCLQIMY
ncbi:hypothetical protein ScPMuIL_000117 [Solemya velum]